MPPLPVLPGLHVVRALEKVGFEVVGIPIPEATSFGAVGSEYFRPAGEGHHPARMGLPSDEMARKFLIEPPGAASLPTEPAPGRRLKEMDFTGRIIWSGNRPSAAQPRT